MNKISILLAAMLLLVLASCKQRGKESVEDFVSAVNLKDTVKIKGLLQTRKAVWDNTQFVKINAESVKIEDLGENRFRAVLNDSTYFVFTEQEKGSYKVDTVKNVFRCDPQLTAKAIKDGLLTTPYDDLDAMKAIQKEKNKIAQEAAQQAFDDEAEKEIKDFYDNYILSDFADPTPAINDLCTRKMKRKLAAAYDVDGFGYASWELRTGVQDGDGLSKLLSVTSLGGGWYKVKFLDMGTSGTKRIKAVKQGDKIYFDDYK